MLQPINASGQRSCIALQLYLLSKVLKCLDWQRLFVISVLQLRTTQDYLPAAMHEAFLAITTEFVLLPWRHAMRSAMQGASQGGSQVSFAHDTLQMNSCNGI